MQLILADFLAEYMQNVEYSTDELGTEKQFDDVDKKIAVTSELVTAKITQIEGKFFSITSLATTSALNTGCWKQNTKL